MNGTTPTPQKETDPVSFGGWIEPGFKNAQLNYVLYLLSFFIGFTAIIGLVFAYINRDKADDVVYTHYTYQIRTFWIGLAYFIASAILMILLVGWLLVIVTSIWYVTRCIVGLMAVSKKQPISNPDTWLV